MAPKKTHEEYMAIARVLGQHAGCEMIEDPVERALQMSLHFLMSNPRCPMCLENAAKEAGKF